MSSIQKPNNSADQSFCISSPDTSDHFIYYSCLTNKLIMNSSLDQIRNITERIEGKLQPPAILRTIHSECTCETTSEGYICSPTLGKSFPPVIIKFRIEGHFKLQDANFPPLLPVLGVLKSKVRLRSLFVPVILANDKCFTGKHFF